MSKESKAALASKDNLWESVSDMIDLQAKGDGKDVARMRSVMVTSPWLLFNCVVTMGLRPAFVTLHPGWFIGHTMRCIL